MQRNTLANIGLGVAGEMLFSCFVVFHNQFWTGQVTMVFIQKAHNQPYTFGNFSRIVMQETITLRIGPGHGKNRKSS